MPFTREIELTPHENLVPGRRPDAGPEYLIFAGLSLALFRNTVSADRRQVILIEKVLPHPINRGYQDWEDFVVESVNGVVPRDMLHLAQILETAQGSWLRIVTVDRAFMTISLEEARAAQRQVLENFGIAEDRSWETEASAVAGARASL